MKDEARNRDSFLRQFIPAPAEPEVEEGLPSLKEGEYRPHARPSNKALHSLHFILPSGIVQSFQYVHLDSNSLYSSEKITLRFMGTQPVTVMIEGRNLWRLYDYLHQHRIAWIMQAVRDFADNGKTIVSSVQCLGVQEQH